MKKFLLAAVLGAFLTPAFAGIDQGVEQGMAHISLLGGFAMPVNNYGFSPNNDLNLDYGDAGVSYGGQIMYYATKNIGLGLEFNAANYGNATYETFVGGSPVSKYKSSADKYSFFVAGKVNFAPDAKTRVYMPLGAGFAKFKGKITEEISNSSKSMSNTKPAFYAGLGLESDLNDIFLWGFEARYNHWLMDNSKFEKTDYLSDVSILLRIGIKL